MQNNNCTHFTWGAVRNCLLRSWCTVLRVVTVSFRIASNQQLALLCRQFHVLSVNFAGTRKSAPKETGLIKWIEVGWPRWPCLCSYFTGDSCNAWRVTWMRRCAVILQSHSYTKRRRNSSVCWGGGCTSLPVVMWCSNSFLCGRGVMLIIHPPSSAEVENE
jgi:hypothetical protein